MTYLLLAIIGFISAHRIICRIEKFFFVNRKNSLTFFVFLTIPIYFFVIIKDHLTLYILYIGLFLVSLIFFSYFFEKKLKSVFLQSHLNLINSLLLQIKSGYSTQKAINECVLQMTNFENTIYAPLNSILKPEFDIQLITRHWQHFYFMELRSILTSETRVIDQLEMFKQGLKVKNRFVARTNQVTRQIKAQAVVATLVYGLIFALSYYQLNLLESPATIICSFLLFLIGLIFIFKLGGTIKWKI
jgi:hypothetical protein